MMRKLIFSFCLMSGALVASAQVNSFEKLEVQLTAPTQTYQAIKHGADSLIAAWHAANPNDSGFAPLEKQFNRWNMFARSRSHIAGVQSSTAQSMKNTISGTPALTYCGAGPAQNAWTSLGPNPQQGDIQAHGLVSCIAVHPTNENVIYAGIGQAAGMFKTTDGGQNWASVTDVLGLPGLGIGGIAIDPTNTNTIIAGTVTASLGYPGWLDFSTQGYGIIRSTDGGQTWTNVGLPATGNCGGVSVIRFNPQNSNIVFAAGACGIYKSINNGQSWTTVLTNLPTNVHFIDMEISLSNPNQICVSSLKVGGVNQIEGAARVFCSTNGGNTFIDRTIQLPNAHVYTTNPYTPVRATVAIALDVSPASPNDIFAFMSSVRDPKFAPEAQAKTNLYKTNDGGVTWTLVYEGTERVGNWGRYRYQFELSDGNVNRVYIGEDVMRTKNIQTMGSGVDWTPISQYWPIVGHHADIRGIVNRGTNFTTGSDILFIANDGGMSKTYDSGNNWIPLDGNGMSIAEIHGFASWSNNDHILAGAMHNGFHSLGGGTRHLFSGVNLLGDGGYSFAQPSYDDIAYVNCNFNIYQVVRQNDGSFNKTANLGLAPFYAKFDATKTPPYKVYFQESNLVGNKIIPISIKAISVDNLSQKSTFYTFPVNASSISSLKIAPSDNNIIYLAFDEPCWSCDVNGGIVTNKLLKYENGQFADLSANIKASHDPNYQYLAGCYIEDIAIDPLNADRVWVAMAYYDPVPVTLEARNRVFFSANGGDTWTDQSKGLLPFPVNCIVYQDGSDDVLYVGTDAGVYYWDKTAENGAGKWLCFNNGLPPAIITKIDVHPCRGVVIASTYGRGMWQAPIIESTKHYTIIANETWQTGTTKLLNSDLVVNAGVTLTIKGTVKFAPGKGLTINPGAKVVLDGGVLTVNNTCGIDATSWEGVGVLGNASLAQNPATHGVLYIINGGTISHARTAVSNVGWAGNDFAWGTQGGIIDATGALFKNNRRDVQLISYHSYIGSFEKPYLAKFINCTFIRDNDYEMEAPIAAVSIWDVNGASFYGCSFNNNATATKHSAGAYGIYALSSQIFVNKYAETQTSFEGYNYGIYATDVCRTDKFTTIANSTFTDNVHGIYLNTHLNPRIYNNQIDVPSMGTQIGQADPYGVYLDASSGSLFTENEFTTSGSGFNTYGVVFNNSGSNANLAYKNTFDGLTYAAQAIGSNMGGTTGLVFQCNRFGDAADNMRDLTVFANSGQPDQGIAANQGAYYGANTDPKDLANNLFSLYQHDIENGHGAQKFNYHYGAGDMRFDPLNSLNIIEVFHQNVNVIWERDCTPKINSNGNVIGSLTELQAELTADDGELSGKRSLYGQLLNGGNTPELEAQILFAGQEDFMGLYIDLMNIAPYVDEGQLMDLINIPNFPELALRNVLVANPHAGRNPEVFEALLQRQPAVSQQTINDVETGSQTITSKDVLEAQMATLQQNINYTVAGLQHIYITDSTFWDTQSLLNLFVSRTEPHHVFMLADYYWQHGQTAALNALLNNVNPEWWGEADHITLYELPSFYTAMGTEATRNLSISSRNALVMLYGTVTSPYIKRKMDGILMAFDANDASYIEPLYEVGNNKTSEPVLQRPASPTSTFVLYPNPAKDYAEIHWDGFAEGLESELTISIYTLSGTLVYAEKVSDYMKNTWLINTKEFETGLYLIDVNNKAGKSIFSKKLSVIK